MTAPAGMTCCAENFHLTEEEWLALTRALPASRSHPLSLRAGRREAHLLPGASRRYVAYWTGSRR